MTPPQMEPRVLIVDDERMVRWSLTEALKGAGYQVSEADTAAAAVAAALRDVPDVILLDYALPDGTGIDVMQKIRPGAPRVPIVMITAHASIGGAVEAIREGAYDYVSKPFDVDELLQKIGRALETSRLREEVARHGEAGRRDYGAQNLIAESAAMKEVQRLVKRVAASEATTILLLGESGVGKGLIARGLHFESSAWEKPFLNITCTALPENLLESELFGHEKGAFTDARAQKKGLLELAEGGTVFLDEIGDLSPSLQGKLLRFLEDRSFRRVGGTRDIRVSLRVIAATNKDLDREVAENRFRRDLYFRLKVIPIVIPPLRERAEDVVPLANAFIRHFDQEFRKSVRGLDDAARRCIEAYDWPGNVRELRNAIERAVLLTDGHQLTVEDLPSEITSVRGAARIEPEGSHFVLPRGGVVLVDIERDLLRQALTAARGNRTRAARLLGLNRDQIRYRIEKYSLEHEFPSPTPDDGGGPRASEP